MVRARKLLTVCFSLWCLKTMMRWQDAEKRAEKGEKERFLEKKREKIFLSR